MRALRYLWCRLVGHVIPAHVVGADCRRCGRFTWQLRFRGGRP